MLVSDIITAAKFLRVQLVKQKTGLATDEDNLIVYDELVKLFMALKSWEMANRKAICKKIFEDYNVTTGDKIMIEDLNGFKIKATNENKYYFDMEELGAEEIEDIEFMFMDDFTAEELECFVPKMSFDFTAMKNLIEEEGELHESEESKYVLRKHVMTKPAAPKLKITEV